MSKLSFREVLETIKSHKPIEKYKRAPNHRRSGSKSLALKQQCTESHSAAVCVDAKRKALQRERERGMSMNSYSTCLCLQTHLRAIVWCSNVFPLWWFWSQKPSFSVKDSQRLSVYTMKIILDIWMLLEAIKFLDINYQSSLPPLLYFTR